MSSLYIGGVQNTLAQFHNYDDWEIFDKMQKKLQVIASKYNLYITRETINDGDPAFVICNEKFKANWFCADIVFNYDMSIKVSEDFDERADKFINEIESIEEFSPFHSLEWTETQCSYFVTT